MNTSITPGACSRFLLGIFAASLFALAACAIPGITEEAPDAPSGLSAGEPAPFFDGDIPQYSVALSWSGSADSWEIWRAEGDSEDYVWVGNSSSTHYADRGLARDTAFKYRVRAVSSGGKSGFSGPVAATTPTVGIDRYETGSLGNSDDGVKTETTLADGSFQIHSIDSAGDADWMTVTGLADAFYRFETRSWEGDTPDTALEIKNESMETLVSDDDGGADGLSRVNWWQCPADGTYFVKVTGSTTGYYSIESETFIGECVSAFPYTENFDAECGLPWSAWELETFFKSAGASSLVTPPTANGEYSAIKLMIDVPANGAALEFDWSVSSEADHDFFAFSIDGTERNSITGDQSWAAVSHTLSSGRHVVEWRYAKDAAGSSTHDQGWLDELSIAAQ